MNQLQVIDYKGRFVADSRDVASVIGKEHKHLLRDIRNYIDVLGKSTFGLTDFFIESYYTDLQGKPRPHFYLTKKGCDIVANKLTGDKGILFTAAYVSKFEEMEKQLQPSSVEDLIIMQAQSVKELKQEVMNTKVELMSAKEEITTVKHRVNNMDNVDAIGDLQQRLNAMVRRYAQQEGIAFGLAWKDFRQAFNTAYRTNLTAKMNNYMTKHGLKRLTMPQYLSLTDSLQDAIRVADKLLNERDAI